MQIKSSQDSGTAFLGFRREPRLHAGQRRNGELSHVQLAPSALWLLVQEKVLGEMANNQEISQTFHECGITNVQIEEAMGIADAVSSDSRCGIDVWVVAAQDGDGVQYEEFVHALVCYTHASRSQFHVVAGWQDVMDDKAQKKDTMRMSKQTAMLKDEVCWERLNAWLLSIHPTSSVEIDPYSLRPECL